MEEKIKRFLHISFGYGSGSGSGYGSGSGSGDGDGYGDGDGVEAINNQKIYMIDDTPTIITSVHNNYAKGFILNSDLTLSPCYIAKVGNYFAHGETLKQAVKDATAKYEQNLPIEERINRFINQYPSLNISAKASELFDWHNKLTGSCLFGRQEFCRSRGIDYTNGYYTVSEFIDITINAYGGDVIKQLKDTYEKKNKDTPRPN